MKETIYTIPINEAFDTECECPMCELERKLENDAVEYALGPAMMEPDFRTDSNKKGYCTHHFRMMLESPKKLPLALILETHIKELSKEFDTIRKSAEECIGEKSGLFKKSSIGDVAENTTERLTALGSSCMVCDKIELSMNRYRETMPIMWAKDETFREKFNKSKGLCIRHLKELTESGKKVLKNNELAGFLTDITKKECDSLNALYDELHKFTLKFDYRNRQMDIGNANDSPKRAIERLTGYIEE